jgi:hypothetical protein
MPRAGLHRAPSRVAPPRWLPPLFPHAHSLVPPLLSSRVLAPLAHASAPAPQRPSTTAQVREGKPCPCVLEIVTGSVDHGACIESFSQVRADGPMARFGRMRPPPLLKPSSVRIDSCRRAPLSVGGGRERTDLSRPARRGPRARKCARR